MRSLTNKNDDNSYKSKLANILQTKEEEKREKREREREKKMHEEHLVKAKWKDAKEEKHLNISFGFDYTVQQNCSHNTPITLVHSLTSYAHWYECMQEIWTDLALHGRCTDQQECHSFFPSLSLIFTFLYKKEHLYKKKLRVYEYCLNILVFKSTNNKKKLEIWCNFELQFR